MVSGASIWFIPSRWWRCTWFCNHCSFIECHEQTRVIFVITREIWWSLCVCVCMFDILSSCVWAFMCLPVSLCVCLCLVNWCACMCLSVCFILLIYDCLLLCLCQRWANFGSQVGSDPPSRFELAQGNFEESHNFFRMWPPELLFLMM